MEGNPGSFPSLAPGSLCTVARYGQCGSPEAFPSGRAKRLTDCITVLHSRQAGSGESRGQAAHGEGALPAASPARLPSPLPLHDSPGLTHPIWGRTPRGAGAPLPTSQIRTWKIQEGGVAGPEPQPQGHPPAVVTGGGTDRGPGPLLYRRKALPFRNTGCHPACAERSPPGRCPSPCGQRVLFLELSSVSESGQARPGWPSAVGRGMGWIPEQSGLCNIHFLYRKKNSDI